jgi:hypothetical protein
MVDFVGGIGFVGIPGVRDKGHLGYFGDGVVGLRIGTFTYREIIVLV